MKWECNRGVFVANPFPFLRFEVKALKDKWEARCNGTSIGTEPTAEEGMQRMENWFIGQVEFSLSSEGLAVVTKEQKRQVKSQNVPAWRPQQIACTEFANFPTRLVRQSMEEALRRTAGSEECPITLAWRLCHNPSFGSSTVGPKLPPQIKEIINATGPKLSPQQTKEIINRLDIKA